MAAADKNASKSKADKGDKPKAMSFAELQIVIDRTASAEREVVDSRAQYASNLSVLEQYVGGPLQ